MTSPLVLYGGRRALERAAAARNLPVLVLADGPAPENARAVVAVAERHVLTAARTGRAGLSMEQALAFRDKLAMKRALRALGLPCTEPDETRFPLVVKPRRGTSGQGRRLVYDRRELAAHLRANAARFPDGFVCERVMRAREISVETFVSRGRVVFQSPTDYVLYGAANRVPAVLDEPTRRRALDLAAQATLGLGLTSGVTHAELWLTESGPVLSEIACRPPGGHLFDLISRAYGVNAWDLYLSCVLGEPVAHPGPARCSAGNLLLHPPPGVIARVHGLAAARRLPGVVRLRHRLEPGRVVPLRTSLGQIAGVLTVEHADPAVVQRTLRQAALSIALELD